MRNRTILVTGGAGYIGTHICVELLAEQCDVVVFDNLSRSHRGAIDRVERIAGRPIGFVEGDLRDAALLRNLFAHRRIDAVIHLAGYKSVGESSADPLLYYDNNVGGMIALCRAMDEASVRTFVYSSSATVYGAPQFLPMTERHPLSPTTPYGQCKLIGEMLLDDLHRADARWKIARLRYFNPVGEHASGTIGEDPRDEPANLVPYVAQVAVGRRDRLTIFGDDYDTPDGTCIRDYIHVADLADAHILALAALAQHDRMIYNLGNGSGFSVRQVIEAARRVTGHAIPVEIKPRRAGDPARLVASSEQAKSNLGWQPKHPDLDDILASAWAWHQQRYAR